MGLFRLCIVALVGSLVLLSGQVSESAEQDMTPSVDRVRTFANVNFTPNLALTYGHSTRAVIRLGDLVDAAKASHTSYGGDDFYKFNRIVVSFDTFDRVSSVRVNEAVFHDIIALTLEPTETRCKGGLCIAAVILRFEAELPDNIKAAAFSDYSELLRTLESAKGAEAIKTLVESLTLTKLKKEMEEARDEIAQISKTPTPGLIRTCEADVESLQRRLGFKHPYWCLYTYCDESSNSWFWNEHGSNSDYVDHGPLRFIYYWSYSFEADLWHIYFKVYRLDYGAALAPTAVY